MEETADMEVDDLFDASVNAALELPLSTTAGGATRSLPPMARQRLDERHLCGCNQRIAWSRQGCIASISPDARTILVQFLYFVPSSGVWELTPPQTFESQADNVARTQQHTTGADIRICHLLWNPAGTELAVFDVVGRVRIWNVSPPLLNRLSENKAIDLDEHSELDQAIGILWLPMSDRTINTVTHSSKLDDHWTPVYSQRKPFGPYWPRALLILTRCGLLRLLYVGHDHKWSEISLHALPVAIADELLTHGALACLPEHKILVAAHATNGTISTFVVDLSMPDWRQDPLVTGPPSMKIEIVKADISNLQLVPDANSTFFQNGQFSNHEYLCLSHLEIVPPTDVEKAVQNPATIFAVYVKYTHSAGLQTATSTIRAWTVSWLEEKLNVRFDEIGSKGSIDATSNNRPRVLRRSGIPPWEQVIASFSVVDGGQTLAITTLDGTTSFYNPATMTELFYESEANEVTSMSQSGFAFPPIQTPFDIAFSSNACAFVSLVESGKLQLSTMEHHAGMQTDSFNSNLDTALAAASMTYMRACQNVTNPDDIIVCILRTISPQYYTKLTLSMTRSLFRDADFLANGLPGSDIERLPNNQKVPRLLCIHAVLGYTSGSASVPIRTYAARYAWVTLHIRHVTLLILFMCSAQKAPKGNIAPFSQDLLAVISNNARWGMDICGFIVDELFELADVSSDAGIYKVESEEPNKILVGCLLTGIWSRHFLRTMIKFLKLLVAMPPGLADPAGILSRNIDKMQATGVTLNAVSTILEACDRKIGVNDPDTERHLIVSGRVPEGGKNLVGMLIKDVLPVLRSRGEIDRLWLYTKDFRATLLEGEFSGKRLDVHTKSVISTGDTDLRTCLRCGSITEGFGQLKKEWPRSLQQTLMRCPCEDGFIGWDLMDK